MMLLAALQELYSLIDMDSSEDGEGTSNVDDLNVVACPIRKRRFSNARIQPTRVKKVMQSDEEIGRMVASVPVAIGSAMEHFAEKLLEAASACVPNSSSRTLSPMHIKYAIIKNPHFSFLEPLVRDIKLPKNADDILVSATTPDMAVCHSPSARYFQASPLLQRSASNGCGPSTSGATLPSHIASILAAAASGNTSSPAGQTLAAALGIGANRVPNSANPDLIKSNSTSGNAFVFPSLASPQTLCSTTSFPSPNLPNKGLEFNGEKKRKRGRPPRIDRPNVGSDFPSPVTPEDILFTSQRPATVQNNNAGKLAAVTEETEEPACPALKRPTNGSTVLSDPRLNATPLPTIFEHARGKTTPPPNRL